MPSGDVIPSGDPSGDGPIPPICAEAELLATKTTVSAASDQRMIRSGRVILMSFPLAGGNRPAPRLSLLHRLTRAGDHDDGP